ncbi:hypothetical protein [Streptomyces albireticuli]|uniref:Uncharacterized protein n=1 Tax=Streptomyces albireticuli TaxID=1940 RepID=A0A2A2DAE0_9ACTN|nr:hypothetical protein [Streptomyces albireticuli]MCD9193380.1 hypothetical protein [Streptomyces albireticuli]PAU48407.1 hypothetical protein CK936_13525 [Streptomyces albireticuli]
MPHTASQALADRIEALYGQPLSTLEAHAGATARDSMLGALLGSHTDLSLAERNIDFQLERLRQLAGPDREIGRFDAGHILDCARRIAESVAVRDAHAKSVTAVLASLRRLPGPDTKSPTAALPAVPARPVPAASRAR